MSTVTHEKKYTPEDLLTMPDGDHYELVDGHLVERNVSYLSSFVGGRIHRLVGNYCEDNNLGWVAPADTGFQCYPDAPNKVRRPDATFIRLERMSVEEASEDGYTHIVPDLVVEVLSPNDLAYEIDRKVQEYRRADVRLIWVVNPDTRSVKVYRADGTLIELAEDDEITGEDVIPGFRCPVREFFRLPVKARPAT
jgi:Uma2 family endonuclease